MMTWAGIAAGIISIIGLVAKWLWSRREREVGRLEKTLEAAERESGRAKDRQKIEAQVRSMGDAAVADELRNKWQRD
jgi:hypothetical protein